MFIFRKIKKSYRFIITLHKEKGELKISKLSSILNQAGLDEAANMDEYLELFFNTYFSGRIFKKRFTAIVSFVRWKNPNLYNHLEIKPFELTEFFLKYRGKNVFKYNKVFFNFAENFFNAKQNLASRAYFFLYGLLEGFKWSIINGFFFEFKDIAAYIQSYRGVKFAYRKRKYMLGRKINFRRKVRGVKFEEYN